MLLLNLLKADIIRVSHYPQLVPLITSDNFLLSPRAPLFMKPGPFDTSQCLLGSNSLLFTLPVPQFHS